MKVGACEVVVEGTVEENVGAGIDVFVVEEANNVGAGIDVLRVVLILGVIV